MRTTIDFESLALLAMYNAATYQHYADALDFTGAANHRTRSSGRSHGTEDHGNRQQLHEGSRPLRRRSSRLSIFISGSGFVFCLNPEVLEFFPKPLTNPGPYPYLNGDIP